LDILYSTINPKDLKVGFLPIFAPPFSTFGHQYNGRAGWIPASFLDLGDLQSNGNLVPEKNKSEPDEKMIQLQKDMSQLSNEEESLSNQQQTIYHTDDQMLKMEEQKLEEQRNQKLEEERNQKLEEMRNQKMKEQEQQRLEEQRRATELETRRRKEAEEEQRRREQREAEERKREDEEKKRVERQRIEQQRIAQEKLEQERNLQNQREDERILAERKLSQQQFTAPLPTPKPTSNSNPSPNSNPVTQSGEDAYNPPQEWQKLIGWCGNISRPQAEQKLKGCTKGTFLLRWSDHARSYVLSYVKPGPTFTHVAKITPEKNGSIVVETEENQTVVYNNLLDFITQTTHKGIISLPVPT